MEGIRVIDTTAWLSFPFGTGLLGAMGADVVKVENPSHGDPGRRFPPFFGSNGLHFGEKPSDDDESLGGLKRHRNKRSVTLEIRSEKGKEILKELVKRGDVFTENFAPGQMDGWGLGYEQMKEVNPKIIYCSISGFGHTGPDSRLPAFDAIAQARSGFMLTTGFPDGEPLKAGPAVGDLIPALYAVIGILTALHYRDKTGKGQRIDIAMTDSLFSFVTAEPVEAYDAYGFPQRAGNHSYRAVPMDSYKTKDGGHVIITVVPLGRAYPDFLKAIEREDLLTNPKFDTIWHRIQNVDDVNSEVEKWTSQHTTEEVLQRFKEFRIPSGRVTESASELFSDPQLEARQMIIDLEHPGLGKTGLKTGGMPIKFSDLEAEYDKGAPYAGQQTDEILSSLLGYSEKDLTQLREEGVI